MYYIDVIFILINYWLIGNCFLNLYMVFNFYISVSLPESVCSLRQSLENAFTSQVQEGRGTQHNADKIIFIKKLIPSTQLLILCIFSKLCYSDNMFRQISLIFEPFVGIRIKNIRLHSYLHSMWYVLLSVLIPLYVYISQRNA